MKAILATGLHVRGDSTCVIVGFHDDQTIRKVRVRLFQALLMTMPFSAAGMEFTSGSVRPSLPA
jgi:hypothetical protein